jgi:hypothetical protein
LVSPWLSREPRELFAVPRLETAIEPLEIPAMRNDLPLKLAIGSGLAAATGAVLLVASPFSLPLFLVAGGALGFSVAELVRQD